MLQSSLKNIGIQSNEIELISSCLQRSGYLFGSFVWNSILGTKDFTDIDIALTAFDTLVLKHEAKKIGLVFERTEHNFKFQVRLPSIGKNLEVTNLTNIPLMVNDMAIDILLLAMNAKGIMVKPLGHFTSDPKILNSLDYKQIAQNVLNKKAVLLQPLEQCSPPVLAKLEKLKRLGFTITYERR